MELLFKAHSGFRWLVLLAAIIAAIVFLLSWLRQAKESPLDRRLMSIFVGLLDLQMLMGLILLLWMGFSGNGFTRARLEHAFIMLLAVVIGHVSAKWKNAAAAIRARNYLVIVVAILLLIYIGVARLPQGWSAMG